MKKIKHILVFFFMGAALMLSACASSQDKAYEAQEKVHNERIQLVEKYQNCLKEAEEKGTDKETCEQYLKAAEALK